MKKIYLVLSFDHELPLGGMNDSYAESLFYPTEMLLEIADSYNVPITLFSDVLCGIRFKEWGVNEFAKPYDNQIQNVIRRGHDVQLHLHPHWLDTTYSNGTFHPSNKYSLNDYKDEAYPNNIYGIVEQGVNFLNALCKQIDNKYRCIAFRAGGYNLCPSTSEILSALWENGIRIDSSISKGYQFKSNISSIDFSNMPQQANWFIPLQGPLSSSCSNGLFQVPIVSVPRTPIGSIPFLIKRLIYKSKRPPKRGLSLRDEYTNILQKLERLLSFSVWMLSFDIYYYNTSNLMNILSTYINQHKDDKVIFASVVGHPKSMGDYNFVLMRDFIRLAKSKYGNQLVFCKYTDVLDLISDCP